MLAALSGCEIIERELSMPDLDLIKQAEQGRGTGAGGLPRAAPAILTGVPRG
jgi:hypothetical protein